MELDDVAVAASLLPGTSADAEVMEAMFELLETQKLLESGAPVTLLPEKSGAAQLLMPLLVATWDKLAVGDARRDRLAAQIEMLRRWDYRWSVESVPTSLAVFWGEDLWRRVSADADEADTEEM